MAMTGWQTNLLVRYRGGNVAYLRAKISFRRQSQNTLLLDVSLIIKLKGRQC